MSRGAAALLALAALARAAAADDAGFELRATDVTVVAGEAAAISLTIAPAAGKTVSRDGPLRVDLDADAGLALARRRYLRRDAADPAADAPRFDLKLKAREPGEHPVALDVHFWLCGAKVCRPVRAQRTVTVHVAAAPGTPSPAPPPP